MLPELEIIKKQLVLFEISSYFRETGNGKKYSTGKVTWLINSDFAILEHFLSQTLSQKDIASVVIFREDFRTIWLKRKKDSSYYHSGTKQFHKLNY